MADLLEKAREGLRRSPAVAGRIAEKIRGGWKSVALTTTKDQAPKTSALPTAKLRKGGSDLAFQHSERGEMLKC
jgi:hypothetical protein